MALNLILDASTPQLSEPGFWQFISTRRLSEAGNPSDDGSYQGIWCDEPTRTLMLRPLQLESTWLNTTQQGDSIIRLDSMAVSAADLTSQSIFEAPAFGNADNPFIFHVPVGPSAAFPSAVAEYPGSPPSLVGINTPTVVEPDVLSIPSSLAQGPSLVYAPSTTMPAAGSLPTPTQIGDTTNGKFLGQSKARMAANQPLFFRWFHPSSMLGFPCIYEFYVGQFKLRVKDVTVEVFRDTSPHGDRTSWQKVMVAPLFSVGSLSPTGTGMVTAFVTPQAQLDHDRTLLWLPFRHNQILLYASTGKWALITVNGSPRRLADGSDWDIVRSDVLLVWVLTPAAGRFQIQQVKYPSGTIKIQSPVVTLDYTPTVAPTTTLTADTDHGTSVSAAQTQPPAYTIPTNSASDCPPSTTTATDLRRQYGVELSFTASGDQRWTPFFYGAQVAASRVFVNSLATPTTIADTNPGSALIHATLTAGLRPGEGRMTAEVMDESPYPLSTYYYRCSMPVQLTDGGAGIFSGVTAPTEVTPLTETGSPRRLTFSALDRWKHLADTYLRDQRDWTTFGHIDVVKFVAEQGGVDCTNAEFPAGYTPGVLNTWNSPLGGGQVAVAQQTKDLKQGWAPRDDDTAASYIMRIQDLYSGWYAGFRLDGAFFYLPRTYFTTPSVVFSSHSDSVNNPTGLPTYMEPVTFTTAEPEANVILVKAASAVDGGVAYSSLWVDWQSIQNPAAVNYLGRWRAEVLTVGGTFSCAQLNTIARTVWSQTRRRFVHASFEAQFVAALKIGQVFTLGSYGNYRLIGMNVKLDHAGFHRASYTGELVEDGF